MKNQKGEVVTGVMVVMMVVMMFLVMPLMHGGHKNHGHLHEHGKNEQKHEHDGRVGMVPKPTLEDPGHGKAGSAASSETVEKN